MNSSLVAILREAQEHLQESLYEFGTGQDPDSTQFSYCRSCGRVEYKPHTDKCEGIAFLRKVEEAIHKFSKEEIHEPRGAYAE